MDVDVTACIGGYHGDLHETFVVENVILVYACGMRVDSMHGVASSKALAALGPPHILHELNHASHCCC